MATGADKGAVEMAEVCTFGVAIPAAGTSSAEADEAAMGLEKGFATRVTSVEHPDKTARVNPVTAKRTAT